MSAPSETPPASSGSSSTSPSTSWAGKMDDGENYRVTSWHRPFRPKYRFLMKTKITSSRHKWFQSNDAKAAVKTQGAPASCIIWRKNRAAQQQSTANDPTHPHSHSFWRFPKLIRTLLLFCTCALLDFKLFPSLTFFWPTFTHSHAIIRTHYSPSQTIAFPTRNFQLLINRNFRRSFKPNYSI